jgi:MoaA/NifB/PqqE/SkfB family radical SAM enzyme
MSDYRGLKRKLLQNAYDNNIPIVGEFELLGNCNFNCAMCYAKTHDKSLSSEEWLDIFKQAYDNGMLYALLTGGEVFLRPDFLRLYNALFDMGVKISIYTNGSKLSEEILETLKKKRPELIAITLYGHDIESYQEFTGIDAFKNVDQAIEKLLAAKLPLRLRTLPMPMIYQNLDKMIEYAKSKNLSLNYFLYIAKTANEFERLSVQELKDFDRRMKKAFLNENTLEDDESHCGAFKYGYFINHQGYMQGCALMPIPTKKVEGNFMEVFMELKAKWDEYLEGSPCKNCAINKDCFTCLAKRYLEGNMFACSDYLKDYAKGEK